MMLFSFPAIFSAVMVKLYILMHAVFGGNIYVKCVGIIWQREMRKDISTQYVISGSVVGTSRVKGAVQEKNKLIFLSTEEYLPAVIVRFFTAASGPNKKISKIHLQLWFKMVLC